MTRLTQRLRFTCFAFLIVSLIGAASSGCTRYVSYTVQVQAQGSGEHIPQARVRLDLEGMAPLRSTTDEDGFARIRVDASCVGQPAVLRIGADGYIECVRHIDLREGLPAVIQLESKTGSSRTEPPSTHPPVSSTGAPPISSSPTVISATDSSDRAVAKQGAGLFVAPDADSTVLGGVSAGEEVRVLGRSAVGKWFYVCDDQEVEGFVYAPWFEWTGEYESLPTKVPRVTITSDRTPAPSIVSSYPLLEMDLWDNPGTGRCYSGGIWDKSVYIQGRGGNGVYTYYWNGEKLIGPTSESYSFDVHSVDAAVIGTAKVVSGDKQVIEREHYVRVPDCSK
jgi:hypothetical protein